jgi:Tol biopolymer transport system component
MSAPMDPNRWQLVGEIYQRVLDSPPERRAGVLLESCSGDAGLLREVSSLLEARDKAGEFLSPGQLKDHISSLTTPPPSTGSTLGPYLILGELGAGAMGEVFRARDTRLDRLVALKVLPAELTHDSTAVARFQTEAKAASALNHPNILTIFDIGQAGDTWFIAAELVEGVTLRQRLAAGPLPAEEALAIGIQCAVALDAAHRAGIVHRDIKPENIMLRPDGVVKVVDFGLARILQTGELSSPHATQTGSVLGTPRYMSPEQARGEKLDGRSDIFSLAAVLAELLTGLPAFPGASTAEVFTALLSAPPVLPERNPAAPVLAKALSKHPAARYQTAAEFAEALRSRPAASPLASRLRRIRTKKAAAPALAAALLLASLALAWHWWRAPPPPPAIHESLAQLVPLTTFPGAKDYVSFSPDGQSIAFSWDGGANAPHSRSIYRKPVDHGNPVRLTDSPGDDTLPAWSPDGTRIAFYRKLPASSRTAVYIIPSTGGPERQVATTAPGVSWSLDGRWLALADLPPPNGTGGIYLLSLNTSARRSLTHPTAATDAYPVFSPNGRWIAFTRTSGNDEIFAVPSSGGAPRQLSSNGRPKSGRPAWTPDSKEILYSTAREFGGAGLWRVSLSGAPSHRIYGTLDFAGNPTVSPSGTHLAYTESWIDTNIYRADGPGFSATGVPGPFGPPQKIVASSREDHSPAISPDGRQIVFASNRTGYTELWISTIDGGEDRQLTQLQGFAGTPRWSPDGHTIAFDFTSGANMDIWTVPASGGPPHRLTTVPAPDTKPSWSPDGAWIYFNSDRSGRPEVWKMKSDGSMPARITFQGGREPIPSADGRTVYYTKGFGGTRLWSVPSNGGPEGPTPGMESFDGIGRLWGVLAQGIYFVSWRPREPAQTIQFFSFRIRSATSLGAWDSKSPANTPGLALSADGRHLLTIRTDQQINDLMMIENFH